MTNQIRTTAIVRWSARILGTLIVAFFLFFLLAHIFGEEESGNGFQNTKEVIAFLFFPISTAIGLSLALKWEGLGGIITLAGMIGLLIVRPDLIKAVPILMPVIPGVLYTIYWSMTRNNES